MSPLRAPLAVALLAVSIITSALAAESLHVTTVAGSPGVPGLADGPRSRSLLNRPTWMDIVRGDMPRRADDGDLFIVDRVNQVVRRFSHGSLFTLRLTQAYYDNSPFSLDFGGPAGGGIAVEPLGGGCGTGVWDRGMFVASSGAHQLALVSPEGTLAARDDVSPLIGVHNVAGARDGNNQEALFNSPTGIALSRPYGIFDDVYVHRFVYVADTGNHSIRRLRFSLSFEACPQARQVETFAGSAGQPGWADGAGSVARFNSPRGLATGPDGSLYVADTGNHIIRKITPEGIVTTIAGEPGVSGSNDGPAREARLSQPMGIDVNAAGEIFIADTGNHTIRKITADGMLMTIAGRPGVPGFADGPAPSSKFSGPVGVRVADDGSIFVADTSNHVIRLIAPHRERVRPIRR
jgi:hypothetical protein